MNNQALLHFIIRIHILHHFSLSKNKQFSSYHSTSFINTTALISEKDMETMNCQWKVDNKRPIRIKKCRLSAGSKEFLLFLATFTAYPIEIFRIFAD